MKHTQTMKHTLTLLIVLLVSLVCGPVAAQAESDAGGPLIPSIAGEWWRAAYSPELPELDSKRGEIVDHTFFRDADGTWQLWTQIRGTRHDRVFFRWTGSTDFENDKQAWKPHRVCWVGDPHAGEMPRTIQAPHCYSEDGRWHMFYGGGGSISRADSESFSTIPDPMPNPIPNPIPDRSQIGPQIRSLLAPPSAPLAPPKFS